MGDRRRSVSPTIYRNLYSRAAYDSYVPNKNCDINSESGASIPKCISMESSSNISHENNNNNENKNDSCKRNWVLEASTIHIDSPLNESPTVTQASSLIDHGIVKLDLKHFENNENSSDKNNDKSNDVENMCVDIYTHEPASKSDNSITVDAIICNEDSLECEKECDQNSINFDITLNDDDELKTLQELLKITEKEVSVLNSQNNNKLDVYRRNLHKFDTLIHSNREQIRSLKSQLSSCEESLQVAVKQRAKLMSEHRSVDKPLRAKRFLISFLQKFINEKKSRSPSSDPKNVSTVKKISREIRSIKKKSKIVKDLSKNNRKPAARHHNVSKTSSKKHKLAKNVTNPTSSKSELTQPASSLPNSYSTLDKVSIQTTSLDKNSSSSSSSSINQNNNDEFIMQQESFFEPRNIFSYDIDTKTIESIMFNAASKVDQELQMNNEANSSSLDYYSDMEQDDFSETDPVVSIVNAL